MAFENTFGNIDFGAPQRQRNLEESKFAQMVGMGMQAAQASADRDLKERQLSQKGDAFKLKQTAETALMKKNMGMPLTPQEQASIVTMAQVAPPSYSTDALGRTVAMPSGWSQLGGGQPQQPPIQPMPQSPQGFQDVAGDGAYNIANEGQLPPVMDRPQGQPLVDPSQFYQAPASFGAKGELMEEEFKRNVAKEQISGAMKEKREMEKKVREASSPEFTPIEGFSPSTDDTKTMKKLVVSKKMLDNLTDDYIDAVDKYGVSVSGTQGAKEIDRVAGKIRMQVKNLEELGALQEPDIKAMNEMLGSAVLSPSDVLNPVSGYTQIQKGDTIAKDSMIEFKGYVDDVVKNNAQTRGFQLKSEPKTQQSSGWSIKLK